MSYSLNMGITCVFVCSVMSETKKLLDKAAARAIVYVVAAIMLLTMTLLIGLFLGSYLDIPDAEDALQAEQSATLLETDQPTSRWLLPWGRRAHS